MSTLGGNPVATYYCGNCGCVVKWMDDDYEWRHRRVSLGESPGSMSFYYRRRCHPWWMIWNNDTVGSIHQKEPRPLPKAVSASRKGTVLIYEEGLTPPPKPSTRGGTEDLGPL